MTRASTIMSAEEGDDYWTLRHRSTKKSDVKLFNCPFLA